ncbi:MULTISPECIES: dipeptide ABC transporter ATP-binding protein [Thalassospira]|uniref:Glutathione import ATP-binding protein GsiA n=1 Tax=Thalassospira xiamenensis TaxID=220697 RepID=A0A367XBP3_9PROT|nr:MULTISPECIES: dipeptide ABC transporter ATP-binding protein [Thalassospira]MBO9509292.1 dipeptide ABC transporter ATP-binding protein [Thalassospira sp. A3_1]KZB54783.1 glutathione ABC transporter ATP-binding protein [Thalassospira xiamenensis]MCH2275675.1 dipeptide ABC transporter ATP-binding protein [Thalassospira sp.]RCK51095.1 glutathione ABC transporter ATP-binding protein [Thalassospira xiamenensis]WOI11116.1 dipeptide ABC transporter ATP-binding protein [Thalassospira lucentensis]
MTDSVSVPILSVEDLSVEFGDSRVIENLSFAVKPGRTLAIVGESGSGKSVTSMSIMRLADMMGASYASGRIRFTSKDRDEDLLALSQKQMRRIRGKDIAMIFQEPMTSLNPVFTIGDQIAESLMLHEGMSKPDALVESKRLLDMVRLPDAQELLGRYPHQLSGGMRQRVMIAMALACRPKVLIADEPTTALDVTIQAQILTIIRDLQQELGMAVIFITHDMGVVAEVADDVVVMWKGKKVEEGTVADIFANPAHPYTQTLLSAVPKLGSMTGEAFPKRFPVTMMDGDTPRLVGTEHIQNTARYDEAPLLSVRDLVTRFDIKKGLFGGVSHRVHAVENVSFDIYRGETLALVGESGSGKSTIGRTIQQLQKATAGNISFEGRAFSAMGKGEQQRLRQEIQYIFQDPFASLDPRKKIGFSIAEPIRTHRLIEGEKQIAARVDQLLERVGLTSAHANRYPHEFSGGQRQRICIARALASNPKLIIADEALSALDVSIQAQIINLFMELQEEHGLAYLFISHDMAVVEKMSHRVAVLYLGQVAELGSRQQVLETPTHPYTQRLLSAVPVADPTIVRDRILMDGEIPSPIRRVGDEPAILAHREIAPGHFVADAR